MTAGRPTARDAGGFEALIPAISAELGRDASCHHRLPSGGRLSVDRPLPFLCVYREPAGRADTGTSEFVTAEASFLIAAGGDESHDQVARLARAIGDVLCSRFGGFLFLEVWSQAFSDQPRGPHLGRPGFRVITPSTHAPMGTARALRDALATVRVDREVAEVDLVARDAPAPPGMRPIARAADFERQTVRQLGLEIDTVYRESPTGPVYPLVLSTLRRQVAQALRRALFDFAHRQDAKAGPEHYQALGPRALIDDMHQADRRLLEIGKGFDFVLLATPTNGDSAWQRFNDDHFTNEPAFAYRPLPLNPDLVKRELYDIPLERIADPTLQHLMRDKRDALDIQISMLAARGTPDFLYGSLRLHGPVDDELLALAHAVLDHTRPRAGPSTAPCVDAKEFRRRARAAITRYREETTTFSARVTRRNDIAAGVMVSKGHLLVSDSLAVTPRRADALIEHEVGTHLVTFYNAADQPFQLLREGLPGFEPLQEGLAVLAEHLAGGLTRARLRLLAARVVAVRHAVEGATFGETFSILHETHGLSARRAFTTALRVHRSGGFTKDAAYLRGLRDVLAYLAHDGDLAALLVGKIALRHVPLVQELTRRNILRPPRLWPHYLQGEAARRRLDACRTTSVLDLCREAS